MVRSQCWLFKKEKTLDFESGIHSTSKLPQIQKCSLKKVSPILKTDSDKQCSCKIFPDHFKKDIQWDSISIKEQQPLINLFYVLVKSPPLLTNRRKMITMIRMMITLINLMRIMIIIERKVVRSSETAINNNNSTINSA